MLPPGVSCLLIALLTTPVGAQLLGEISFPNSGAPGAQKDFIEGVLYLHNFEYEDAAEAFVRAQQIDPEFALAYWGEAMTYNHPVWMRQDTEAGRRALDKLAPSPEQRLLVAGTEREAAYLEAIESLYGTTLPTSRLSKQERDDVYLESMRRLHERYPDDDEATTFYALAILGSAHEGRDFSTYMRAAATADTVWDHNEQHPGAAHYLIHSYDDPIHAPLGLPMARAYAKIAPAAAHAQHMTSHIFVALGLWQDAVDANIIASRVQNLGLERKARSPSRCGHFPFWLQYSLLQQGRYAEAREVLDACRSSDTDPGNTGARWHRATMDAGFVIDAGAWDEPMTVTATSPEEGLHNAIFIGGLAAYHRGEGDVVSRAGEQLGSISSEAGYGSVSFGQIASILALELQGLGLLPDDPEAAIARLEQAVAAEADLPYMFGPPRVVKPTLELLGEVLLARQRHPEAAAAFRRQLERTPGRAASLRGLAQSSSIATD
jgi:tetratricopeptide (TPR) repeat protein